MTRLLPDLHAVVHTHRFGTDRTLFLPPKGFSVPYGLHGADQMEWQDDENLSALLSYLDVDFEPSLQETVEILQLNEEIREPSFRDLQRLGPRKD